MFNIKGHLKLNQIQIVHNVRYKSDWSSHINNILSFVSCEYVHFLLTEDINIYLLDDNSFMQYISAYDLTSHVYEHTRLTEQAKFVLTFYSCFVILFNKTSTVNQLKHLFGFTQTINNSNYPRSNDQSSVFYTLHCQNISLFQLNTVNNR